MVSSGSRSLRRNHLFGAVYIATLMSTILLAGQAPVAMEQRPLSVSAALVLTSEFCGTIHRRRTVWLDKEKFPVGKFVCPAAAAMAGHVFSSVEVFDHKPAADETAATILLTPKLVDTNATSTAWGKREIIVLLEWTATDRDGKDLWIQTVQGSGTGGAGNTFTKRKQKKKILRRAVDDLMAVSRLRLSESPELRGFADQSGSDQ